MLAAFVAMASCEKEPIIEMRRFDVEVIKGEIRIEYFQDGNEIVTFLEAGYKPVWNNDYDIQTITVRPMSDSTIYSVDGRQYDVPKKFVL